MSLLKDLCVGYEISFPVMAAICETESNWDTHASRYEARFKYIQDPVRFAKLNKITTDTEKNQQMTSWGIAQIMGASARGCGYKGPLVRLCEPEIGLNYACLYFKNNCDRYPAIDRKISAYNAGAPRYDRGRLSNQEYVDKVMSCMRNYE